MIVMTQRELAEKCAGVTIKMNERGEEATLQSEIGVEKPNKETLEALDEVKNMKANPDLGKKYSDVNEMMKDLLS